MQTDGTWRADPPQHIRSLSRPVSPWTITWATVVKGLQVAWRYKPNLIGNFIQLAVRILFFMLIASAARFGSASNPDSSIAGDDLFLFFLGGLLLLVFNGPTLWGPINAVTSDLYNGTLEFLYSNPGSRYAYYVGTVLADVTIAMIVFVPFFIFLAWFAQAGLYNMGMVLFVCATVLVALTAMGVMIGLLALLWRQVSSIAQVLGILFEFLAGAYLPVSTFPQPLQYLAYLLPYTWGYDLIRYYSFDGTWQTILPPWQEWLILVAYAILFTVLSRYLLKRAETYAKRSGLHII